MEKPIIGVTPLWDEEKNSYWMLPGYLEGVKEAGAIPVILPLTADGTDIAQLMDLCDGFLFTGGQDVDPQSYGEAMKPFCGELCPARDAMEQEVAAPGPGAGQARPGHLPRPPIPECSLGRYPLSGPANGAPVRDRAFHEAAIRPDGPHGAYVDADAIGRSVGKDGAGCQQLPSPGDQDLGAGPRGDGPQ